MKENETNQKHHIHENAVIHVEHQKTKNERHMQQKRNNAKR